MKEENGEATNVEESMEAAVKSSWPPYAINAPPITHKTAFLAFRIRKKAGIEDRFWLSTTRV